MASTTTWAGAAGAQRTGPTPRETILMLTVEPRLLGWVGPGGFNIPMGTTPACYFHYTKLASTAEQRFMREATFTAGLIH